MFEFVTLQRCILSIYNYMCQYHSDKGDWMFRILSSVNCINVMYYGQLIWSCQWTHYTNNKVKGMCQRQIHILIVFCAKNSSMF